MSMPPPRAREELSLRERERGRGRISYESDQWVRYATDNVSHQREPINPACTEIILGILSSPSLSGFLLFTRDLSTATDFRLCRIKVTNPSREKQKPWARIARIEETNLTGGKETSIRTKIFKHPVRTRSRYEEKEEGKSKLDSEISSGRKFINKLINIKFIIVQLILM